MDDPIRSETWLLNSIKRALQESEKKPKLGSGERFQELSGELEAKGAEDPDALAAWIGRKKWGAKRMAKMAKAGR